MASLRDVLRHWSDFDGLDGRHVHPADRGAIEGRAEFRLDLLPQPWVGDLLSARVFILQLNPGFSGDEVTFEQRRADFRSALLRNLGGTEPHLFLAEPFHTHPGCAWTERHLRGMGDWSHLQTLVAQVELFPYHSVRRPSSSVIGRTASSSIVRRWVHQDLVPRARDGEITLIVQRGARDWGFADTAEFDGLVIYRGGECRGGYVTPRTRGGQAARRHLDRVGRTRSAPNGMAWNSRAAATACVE